MVASSARRRPLNRSGSLNISISCAPAEKAYGTSVVIVARTMILTNMSDSDDW